MIVEFSVIPIGKEKSLSNLVAKVIDIVDQAGLPYQLTAMGTIVEGEWDDVFALIKKCHMKMKRSAARVETRISVDDRDKAKGQMIHKVEVIEEILKRRVHT